MKILRSKGRSYTAICHMAESDRTLGRGLRLQRKGRLTPLEYASVERIEPSGLPAFIVADCLLKLRQTISVLDKVIRKPWNLRNFELSAYRDRTLLAEALWKLLRVDLEKSARGLPENAFEELLKTWRSKVHPYAWRECDPSNPSDDGNSEIIKNAKSEATRDDFRGRWHAALWRENDGEPDYEATARAIWEHLFKQERKIDGTERRKGGHEGDVGLVEARGHTIVTSVSDPRQRRKRANTADDAGGDQGGAQEHSRVSWEESDARIYFSSDVAKEIFNKVTDPDNGLAFFNASDFGKILYAHFGVVLETIRSDDPGRERERKRIWSLHNDVRQFYQKLARSERFRRAYMDTRRPVDAGTGGITKLRSLLPKDAASLLTVLGAKRRNASLGALIRLGKIIAHASDLPFDTEDMGKVFRERLDYYVTSDGQSEIKRNEAFTRVWRTSVAMAAGTLRPWAGVGALPADDKDIVSTKAAKAVVGKTNDASFGKHLRLVFGEKPFGPEGKGRNTLFLETGAAGSREMLWALLRLAGEIRDRTNHFNTKRNLMDLVTRGIVVPAPHPQLFESRAGEQVHSAAVAAFGKLLSFDIDLQDQIVLDELKRIQAIRYVPAERVEALMDELAPVADDIALTAPKFMTVITRAHNLATTEPTAVDPLLLPFGALDLTGLSRTSHGENHFRVGLLRQLYSRGFITWLHGRQDDPEFLRTSVRSVVGGKKERFAKAEKRRFYARAEVLAEELDLASSGSLAGLVAVLSSEAAAEERLRRSYKVKAEDQRERSNWIDEFKRDLFGLFFGRYLKDRGLDWIWTATEQAAGAEQELRREQIRTIEWTPEAWEAQFYAWLYLVPVDQVALLRHQFRKTAVLDAKAGAPSAGAREDEALRRMDRLMRLYIAVQPAGFSGDEHKAGLDIGTLLYEDEDLFEKVYSDSKEFHHVSVPGTRRGLRQILRFGHLDVLKGIFEKHRITKDEVDAFTRTDAPEVKRLFEERNTLRKEIVSLAGNPKPDRREQAELERLCREYRQVTAKTALHGFMINGARLTEHARLHHLLMRVIGRLTDFTLMWERDHHYAYLGMLYGSIGGQDFMVESLDASSILEEAGLRGRTTKRIAIRLPDSLRSVLDATEKAGVRKPGVQEAIIRAGFLPLWDSETGIAGFAAETALLKEEDRALFLHYFVGAAEENPKDVAVGERHERAGEKRRESKFACGRRQIRNDFAHLNVIDDRRRVVKLSYLVSSVRSLMSYDRKLKNAVSKAVADIVREDGLEIRWELDEDRLMRPSVWPCLETHLSMVKEHDTFKPRFKLPQASVRYTSMVKALFDMESGGYREPATIAGETKRRGILRYPAEFRNKFEKDIPPEIFVSYASLPKK